LFRFQSILHVAQTSVCELETNSSLSYPKHPVIYLPLGVPTQTEVCATR